ncbi:hypothetical protein KIH74_03690 [Kineosporia sp. J2-2]|uniref:Uncharacterized protein n=1 Tax=Kineosporia corallincola TaxID=2835133 RepID=A0ABS5TCU3_9ACTN|nr:hypothetical protein [Kineosporia corallincola]MBT0768011.1 hypothetical protein [Kineosporia corallincola]
MSEQGWAEYAEYARRLDEVRAQETARTAGIREGVAEMSDHADELVARLERQRLHMTAFAQKVRFRPPSGAGTPQEGHVEPQTDLSRVAELIDIADREGGEAHNRAIRPNLMPGAGPRLRGVAVFGATMLVLMVVQWIAFARTNNNPDFIMIGVILPLIGFVVSLLVLRFGNQARDRDVRPAEIPTRMGLLMCFGALPVLWGILVLASR